MLAGKKWYVIYTRPRSEKKLAAELEMEGYEVFCPLIHTMRQWSDRKKHISLPMFPSYLFVCIIESERDKILQHQAALKFVYWLGKPALVRQNEIDTIREVCRNGQNIIVEQAALSEGDEIEIREGLFKGLSGLVNRKEKNRLLLFIKELNMKVSFELKKVNQKL